MPLTVSAFSVVYERVFGGKAAVWAGADGVDEAGATVAPAGWDAWAWAESDAAQPDESPQINVKAESRRNREGERGMVF